MKLNTFSKGIKEHGLSVTRRANDLKGEVHSSYVCSPVSPHCYPFKGVQDQKNTPVMHLDHSYKCLKNFSISLSNYNRKH